MAAPLPVGGRHRRHQRDMLDVASRFCLAENLAGLDAKDIEAFWHPGRCPCPVRHNGNAQLKTSSCTGRV